MTYAYIRVSTSKQDTENQKYEILNYSHNHNMQIDKIVDETVSSKKPYTDRALGKLISSLKAGDILVTTELSRFGRSLLEVMTILHNLMNKNIKVHITKMNLILGDNIQSKVLAFAFSLSAEIERELISSRTKEALARVKAEGKTLGRPKGSLSTSKLQDHLPDIQYYLSKKLSIASICKLVDCAPSTFYNFCKSRNISIEKKTK